MEFVTFDDYVGSSKRLTRERFLVPGAPPTHAAVAAGRPFVMSVVDVYDQLYTSSYTMGLYGAGLDGAKVKLNVYDIPVTFDVVVPPGVDIGNYQHFVRAFSAKAADSAKITLAQGEPTFQVVEQNTARGFTTAPLQWLRLGFHKLKTRNAVLDAFVAAGPTMASELYGNMVDANGNKIPVPTIITANDDGGNFRVPHNGYPLKAAREHGRLLLGGWNLITRYTPTEHVAQTPGLMVLDVRYADITAPPARPTMYQELVLYWDIETHKASPAREFPDPTQAGDALQVASFAVGRVQEPRILARALGFFMDGHTAARARDYAAGHMAGGGGDGATSPLTVVACADERQLCELVIRVLADLLPDYWVDFNGLGFDQRYLKVRLARYPMIDKDVHQWWAVSERGYVQLAAQGETPATLLDQLGIDLQTPYGVGWLAKKPFEGAGGGGTRADGTVYGPRSNLWVDHRIKISADKTHTGSAFMIPGVFYVDAHPTMMQALPGGSKNGLKDFLEQLELPAKHDMPAMIMFKLFAAPAEPYTHDGRVYTFAGLLAYAAYDAEACHGLMLKTAMFVRRHAEAVMSETSMYDAYYHAGGMKSRNMLMARGFRGVLWFDGRVIPTAYSVRTPGQVGRREPPVKVKYPGALVIEPLRFASGRCPQPFSALDFASLYPSIMMAFDLGHETSIKTAAAADQAAAAGYVVKAVDFPYGDQRVHAWTVRYVTAKGGPTRGMGVMPTVLAGLKADRNVMKRRIKELNAAVDEIKTHAVKTPEDLARMAECELGLANIDAEQKALKVLMNTFYGESGNQLSPFFTVGIAGSITTIGQEMLRFVAKKAEEQGFQVVYGDTDSIYSMAPPAALASVDAWYAAYRAGARAPPPAFSAEIMADALRQGRADKLADDVLAKLMCSPLELTEDAMASSAPWYVRMTEPELDEEWCRRRTVITMWEAQKLNKFINDALVEHVGNDHLAMAFEEVLANGALMGKKKYMGVKIVKPYMYNMHLGYDPETFFVRGLDFIKRGMAPIMKLVAMELIEQILAPGQALSNRELVVRAIEGFRGRAWEPAMFVKSAEYKPAKKNVAVHTFVARMAAATEAQQAENARRLAAGLELLPVLYRAPEPGERFEFVYVDRPSVVTARGHRTKVSAGDEMEYVCVVKHLGLPLNMTRYMAGGVVGLLARFVLYDEQFMGPYSRGMRFVEDNDEADDAADAGDAASDDGGAAPAITDQTAIGFAKKYVAELVAAATAASSADAPGVRLADVKRLAAARDAARLAALPTTAAGAYRLYSEYANAVDGSKISASQAEFVAMADARARALASTLVPDCAALLPRLTAAVDPGAANPLVRVRDLFSHSHGTLAATRMRVVQAMLTRARGELAACRLGDVANAELEARLDAADAASVELLDQVAALYYRLVGAWALYYMTERVRTVAAARVAGIVVRPSGL